MAVAYFDSSALVKLVLTEDESELAATLWDSCDVAVSSRLAYPEVRAALAAAGRSGRLGRRALEDAETLWAEIWSEVFVVALSEPIAFAAGDLATRHGLRGGDAVHLASAETMSTATVLFVAWDQRLREGAVARGLAVVPALN